MIANRAEQEADKVVRVVGKHCESSDVLVRETSLASPEPGDTVIPTTGAYCFAMASNYNGTVDRRWLWSRTVNRGS